MLCSLGFPIHMYQVLSIKRDCNWDHRRAQTPGLALPADTGDWLHGNWQGQAVQLAYDAAARSWSRGAATPVSWTPPVADAGTTLYRCCAADIGVL